MPRTRIPVRNRSRRRSLPRHTRRPRHRRQLPVHVVRLRLRHVIEHRRILRILHTRHPVRRIVRYALHPTHGGVPRRRRLRHRDGPPHRIETVSQVHRARRPAVRRVGPRVERIVALILQSIHSTERIVGIAHRLSAPQRRLAVVVRRAPRHKKRLRRHIARHRVGVILRVLRRLINRVRQAHLAQRAISDAHYPAIAVNRGIAAVGIIHRLTVSVRATPVEGSAKSC